MPDGEVLAATRESDIEDLLQSLRIDNSAPGVSELDEKLIKYLDLLDQYTEICSQHNSHLKNGFINLSRANYASGNRRFNSDFYDHREVDACIKTDHINGKFLFVNNIRKAGKGNSKDLEKMAPETASSPVTTTLKNRTRSARGQAQDEEKVSELKTTPQKPRNPISMFGAFVPMQLRDSQKDFISSLEESVKLINIRNELQELYREIESTKKQTSA